MGLNTHSISYAISPFFLYIRLHFVKESGANNKYVLAFFFVIQIQYLCYISYFFGWIYNIELFEWMMKMKCKIIWMYWKNSIKYAWWQSQFSFFFISHHDCIFQEYVIFSLLYETQVYVCIKKIYKNQWDAWPNFHLWWNLNWLRFNRVLLLGNESDIDSWLESIKEILSSRKF